MCLLAPLQRALAAAPHAFDPKRDSYERLLAASGGRPVVAYALQRSGSNLWLMLLHEAYGVQVRTGIAWPRASCRFKASVPPLEGSSKVAWNCLHFLFYSTDRFRRLCDTWGQIYKMRV